MLIRVSGLFWGLPATDGWDNDGIAPRDFLPGLIQTFAPGEYYTYPPLHAVLLAVVNLPVLIAGVVTAPSFEPMAIRDHFLQPWLMTPIAVLSRVVAIVFAAVTMHAICTLSAEIAGGERRQQQHVRRWTAAVFLCNVVLAYYGQTTNLDGPYVAWTALAFLALYRALQVPTLGSLRPFVVYAAFAVSTKDQAYASFALGVPLVLLTASTLATAGQKLRVLGRTLLAGVAVVALVLVVDGALFNPRGFIARVHFLIGPASKQHENYAHSVQGALACIQDVAEHWNYAYPYMFAPVMLLGIGVAVHAHLHARRTLASVLLPLLGAISFTLAFNVTAGRTDHRFVLPQSVFLTVYLGLGVAWIARHVVGRLVASLALAYAFWAVIGLEVALWNDPRYAAEAWMRDNLRPRESVEVYGESVYMPRFRSDLSLVHVAPGPLTGRNPIVHATELQAEIGDARQRKPEFILLTQVWAARYLMPPPPSGIVPPTTTRGLPPHFKDIFGDVKTHQFITSLAEQSGDYVRVASFRDEPKLWNKLQLHSSASCDCEIWIYQRRQSVK